MVLLHFAKLLKIYKEAQSDYLKAIILSMVDFDYSFESEDDINRIVKTFF